MPQAGRSSQLGLRHAARRTNRFAACKTPSQKASRGTLNRSVHRAALSSCRLLRGCASAATDAGPGRVPALLAALASCHGGKYLPSSPPTVNLRGQGTNDCGVLLEAWDRTTMSPLRHPPKYPQSSPLTQRLYTTAKWQTLIKCWQLKRIGFSH